jgi:hypothetical protein
VEYAGDSGAKVGSGSLERPGGGVQISGGSDGRSGVGGGGQSGGAGGGEGH